MYIILFDFVQIVEAKSDQEKIVPRKFLELGPNGDELSHNYHSSSEERTVSESPRKDIQVTRHNKGIIGREESPESESWVPKLNSSMPIDQTTNATMRKARVSVRARSEAPMVHHFTNSTVKNSIYIFGKKQLM